MRMNPPTAITLPTATALQLLTLTSLCQGSAFGKQVRASLKAAGIEQTNPSFYQMMSRLEHMGWVLGEYVRLETFAVGGRERIYTLTTDGALQLHLAKQFYAWLKRANPDG